MKKPLHYAIVAAAALALTACSSGNNPNNAGNNRGAGNNPPSTASNTTPDNNAANQGNAGNNNPNAGGNNAAQPNAGNAGGNNAGNQGSGTAERSANSNLSGAERQFLTNTAESTMAGLQMAQIASARASSAPVRSYAQQLAGTYQNRLSQLQQIASNNGVNLPNTVNNADRGQIDALSNMSGPQFDQAFLSAAVSNTQRDTTAFALEAANGSDQRLKKLASDALPQMQASQQYAKGMLAQLQAGGNAGANANRYQGNANAAGAGQNNANPSPTGAGPNNSYPANANPNSTGPNGGNSGSYPNNANPNYNPQP